MPQAASRCPGCGAVFAARGGATHPYIGASPECWAVYGEVLAAEYVDASRRGVHRLTVDAYAVQHPGEPARRPARSVAIHLIGLCLALDRGYSSDAVGPAVDGIVARLEAFHWLEPPPFRGLTTVRDVVGAPTADEHRRRVEAWARDVWATWSPHHEVVRGWLDRVSA